MARLRPGIAALALILGAAACSADTPAEKSARQAEARLVTTHAVPTGSTASTRPSDPTETGSVPSSTAHATVSTSSARAGVESSAAQPATGTTSSTPSHPARVPAPARIGTPAPSSRVRFVPTVISLPGHGTAPVVPEHTEDGALVLPKDIRTVGWWDGSAYVGDPFGAVVLAGHVDSRVQGFGFFAALLEVGVGDRVTVGDGKHSRTFRVTATTLVRKDILAADTQALGQDGPPRLVLITCSGRWQPELRSYESNLVVLATPIDQG